MTTLSHSSRPGLARWALTTPMGVTVSSMVLNTLLTVIKAVVGVLAGSGAMLAEAVHSGSDLISDFVVVAGLGVSRRAPDETHPYGHRRVQTLAVAFIGMLIIAAAVGVAYGAVVKWRAGVVVSYGWWPFIVSTLSVVWKEALFRVTMWVSRRHGDPSLRANAWHTRGDAIGSLGASAGMFAVAVGGPDWGFIDHITAIALGSLLAVIGIHLVVQASQELIDRAPSAKVMEGIASVVRETHGVRSYHAFRMRQVGGRLEMDVHIQVDPKLTVAQGHDIASTVRRRIFRADSSVTSVIVHVEPAEGT